MTSTIGTRKKKKKNNCLERVEYPAPFYPQYQLRPTAIQPQQMKKNCVDFMKNHTQA